MPIYDYRCECGRQRDEFFSFDAWPHPKVMCACGAQMRRALHGEALARPHHTEPYFDHSLGQTIRSERDRKDALKRLGDEQNTTMVDVDPRDRDAVKVTDEGMDQTARAATESGERDPVRYL